MSPYKAYNRYYQDIRGDFDFCQISLDPHSSDLVERHKKYTRRLCAYIRARGGVLLSELVDFFKAIELVTNKIDDDVNYGESLIEVIKLMGGALLKSKTSDEQKYHQVTIQSLEQLALLLQIPYMTLRKTLIQARVQNI